MVRFESLRSVSAYELVNKDVNCDIAAKAGVSVSTASRALNNNPRIVRQPVSGFKHWLKPGIFTNYNAKI